MPPIERVFSRSDSCAVWVSYDDYEYSVTVAPDQLDRLRRALAADGPVDVLDLVCAHADEILARGERSRLDDHGIERGFSSY